VNANAIFKGHEYAYVSYPRRNVNYYPGADRVRVVHVYKVEDEWRRRKLTLVEVEVLDNDTGNPLNGNGPVIKTLQARQIVARWDEHLIEKGRHDEIQRERDERYRKINEERLRQQEEERRKREEMDSRIYEELESIGIPRSMVTLRSYEIVISRHGLDELLKGGEADGAEGVR
jgi:hypothetical protein